MEKWGKEPSMMHIICKNKHVGNCGKTLKFLVSKRCIKNNTVISLLCPTVINLSECEKHKDFA